MTTSVKTNVLSNGLFDVLFSIEKRLQRRSIFKRTFAELNALSDRELWDLGISRGEVAQIARDAAKAA